MKVCKQEMRWLSLILLITFSSFCLNIPYYGIPQKLYAQSKQAQPNILGKIKGGDYRGDYTALRITLTKQAGLNFDSKLYVFKKGRKVAELSVMKYGDGWAVASLIRLMPGVKGVNKGDIVADRKPLLAQKPIVKTLPKIWPGKDTDVKGIIKGGSEAGLKIALTRQKEVMRGLVLNVFRGSKKIGEVQILKYGSGWAIAKVLKYKGRILTLMKGDVVYSKAKLTQKEKKIKVKAKPVRKKRRNKKRRTNVGKKSVKGYIKTILASGEVTVVLKKSVGLQEGDKLYVVRGKNEIGRIEVTKVSAGWARAKLLPMLGGLKIMPKDTVTNEKPRAPVKKEYPEVALKDLETKYINTRSPIFYGFAEGEESKIVKVQYSFDKVIWREGMPEDGIYDSVKERFLIKPRIHKDGKYTLYVKAKNEQGRWTKEGDYGILKFELDTKPPFLEAAYSPPIPKEGQVEISGVVEHSATVSINGHKVKQQPRGKFKGIIQLEAGKNVVKVIARDKAGNVAKQELTITYRFPGKRKKGGSKIFIYVLIGAVVLGGALALGGGSKGSSSSETGIVKGSVLLKGMVNRKRQKDNSGVKIYVVDHSSVSTTSASDGSFELKGVPIGQQIIRAEKQDYMTQEQTVTVEKDRTVTGMIFNLLLSPEKNTADGWSKYQNGDYPGAVTEFKKVFNKDATSLQKAQAYSGIGWSKAMMGSYTDAITSFDQALNSDTGMIEALVGKASALFSRGNGSSDYQDSITFAKEALGVNPTLNLSNLGKDYGDVHSIIASSYIALGGDENFRQARTHVDMALEADPSDATAQRLDTFLKDNGF